MTRMILNNLKTDKMNVLTKNLYFVISAAAYILLSVPSEFRWIFIGLVSGFLLYIITRFFNVSIINYVKSNSSNWISAISICFSLILGLRFEKVWRYSSQVRILAQKLNISSSILLIILGIFLGVLAVYFFMVLLTFLINYPQKYFKLNCNINYGKRIKNKSLILCILMTIILQLCVLTYWGIQKSGYHVDEVYTYELSNYKYTNYNDTEGAYSQWITGENLKTILEPDGTELFNLTVPYWNSETDNHPMTYYVIINFLSSLSTVFHLGITKWIGLIPNFIACLATTTIIILIGYCLTEKNSVATAIGMSWAFSIGAINTAVYIRMYALLTFWCVLFAYYTLLFLKKTNDESLDKHLIHKIQICTICGILSQYYFLIFAFYTCAITFFILLVRRKFDDAKGFFFTEIFSVFCAELLFPRMFIRLLFGDRGTEALNNFTSSNFLLKLKDIMLVINNEIFAGNGFIIITSTLLVIFLALIIRKYRNKTVFLEDIFIIQMMMVTLFYIVTVTKIAPYMSDRYFMCIFPISLICISYCIYNGIKIIFSNIEKKDVISFSVLTCFIVLNLMLGFKTQKINYIYRNQIERRSLINTYGDLPTIVMNNDIYDDSILKWNFELQEYSHLYLCRHKNLSDLNKALDKKMNDGFLLYAHMYKDEKRIIKEVKKNYKVTDYKIITTDSDCIVIYFK